MKSPFQEWLDKHALKTTLHQQVELAIRLLYDDAEGEEENTNIMVEAIVEGIENTPVGEHDHMVSWNGISVDWFLDEFCELKFVKRLEEFGCELWFVRKVCIIVLLWSQGICSGRFIDNVAAFPAQAGDNASSSTTNDQIVSAATTNDQIVSNATTFLSYTGGYSFAHFKDMLRQLRGKYIWMDIFCVDQFVWTGRGRSAEIEHFRSELLNGLHDQIETINNTALMLESWSNVAETLKQIWVLWEIFNTVKANASFSILVSKKDTGRYLEALQTGNGDFDLIQAALMSIDAGQATAENDDDRRMILEQMEMNGGFHDINCQVTAQLREWFIKTGDNFVSANHMRQDIHGAMHNLALLKAQQGKLVEAEQMFTDALHRRQRELVPNHPDTVSTMHELANVVRQLGRVEEAQHMFQDVLQTTLETFGENHPQSLSTMNNLACILRDQGYFEEADAVFDEVLSAKRERLGDNHPSTLLTFHNLACLRRMQGRLMEAEQLFEEVLRLQRGELGDEHPYTLTTMNDLACLMAEQGRLEESEALFRKVLHARQRILGPEHPDTLATMADLKNVDENAKLKLGLMPRDVDQS